MNDDELFRMTNGRHKGELITRVPLPYLKWMINIRHDDAANAEAELKRRGSSVPDIEVSGHAIDRASLRIRKIWHQDRLRMPFHSSEEGLYSWLARRGFEAYGMVKPGEEKAIHIGVEWTFQMDGIWPVIKSVWEA